MKKIVVLVGLLAVGSAQACSEAEVVDTVARSVRKDADASNIKVGAKLRTNGYLLAYSYDTVSHIGGRGHGSINRPISMAGFEVYDSNCKRVAGDAVVVVAQ